MWNQKNHFVDKPNISNNIKKELMSKEREGSIKGFMEFSNLISRMTYKQKNKGSSEEAASNQSKWTYIKKAFSRSLFKVKSTGDAYRSILAGAVSFILSVIIVMLILLLQPSKDGLEGLQIVKIIVLSGVTYSVISLRSVVKHRKKFREYQLYNLVNEKEEQINWEEAVEMFYQPDLYSLLFKENSIAVNTYLITPNIVGGRKQYINGIELITQYIMSELKREGVTAASLFDTHKHGLTEMNEITNSGLSEFVENVQAIIHRYVNNDPHLKNFSEVALESLVEAGVLVEYRKVFDSTEMILNVEDVVCLLERVYVPEPTELSDVKREVVPSQ